LDNVFNLAADLAVKACPYSSGAAGELMMQTIAVKKFACTKRGMPNVRDASARRGRRSATQTPPQQRGSPAKKDRQETQPALIHPVLAFDPRGVNTVVLDSDAP
jgi:hypothetical protein